MSKMENIKSKKENTLYPRNKKKKTERIGECRKMTCGEKATIIEYQNSQDIMVEFKDCMDKDGLPVRKRTTYANFLRRSISCIPKKKDALKPGKKSDNDTNKRLNMTITMNNGETATIVGYRNARDIDVLFENGILIKGARYHDFIHKKMSTARKRNAQPEKS